MQISRIPNSEFRKACIFRVAGLGRMRPSETKQSGFVEIRQLVRNHFSQERPLERTGVANLVRIPLHHSVLPLVHPARWQALELRVVLWQMHQPMELRVQVRTPARIHTQVQEDLDATQRDGT